jgi:hypothetical protein
MAMLAKINTHTDGLVDPYYGVKKLASDLNRSVRNDSVCGLRKHPPNLAGVPKAVSKMGYYH